MDIADVVTLLVEIVDDLIASGQTASPEFTDVSTHYVCKAYIRIHWSHLLFQGSCTIYCGELSQCRLYTNNHNVYIYMYCVQLYALMAGSTKLMCIYCLYFHLL